MNDDERFSALIVLSIMLTLVIISGIVGVISGKSSMRTEAIEAGAAEWRIDPQTGVAEFHWIGSEK